MSWIYALSYSVMLSLSNIDLSVSVTSRESDYSSPSSPGISRSAGLNLINERYVINGRPPYSHSLFGSVDKGWYMYTEKMMD